jgi:O-glycosyl hydrolase
MRLHLFGAFVSAVVGVFPLSAQAQTRVLTLSTANTYQTIAGWGTHIQATDTNTRNAYRDLGLNIMRMSMPKEVLTANYASDWITRVPLGTNLQDNIAKFNFNVTPVAQYAATAQWLAANVREPSRFKLIADSWSPPHWMKGPTGATQQWVGNPSFDSPSFATPWLSNTYNHWYTPNNHFLSYTGDSIGGRVRTEDATNLAEYGRFFAAYVKGFEQRYNVPIDNISLQNESGFENPFDSATMLAGPFNGSTYPYDAAQYARCLKSVRDAFAQQGVTTKIRGPHYANLQQNPGNPWGLLHQQNMIDAVKNDADPTLKNAMWSYTSNYYNDTSIGSVQNTAAYWHGRNAVPAAWAGWTNAPGIRNDGKENWFVETGDGSGNWLDGTNFPGTGAITVALKMHNALVHADASAYLYWSFVDGATAVTEHGLLASNQTANPMSSKKYNAFGQFSKFVRPGAQRIAATFTGGATSILGANTYDSLSGLSASAYHHDADNFLTIVLLNLTTSSQTVQFNIPAGLSVAFMTQTRTSATENFLSLTAINTSTGSATITIPSYSVVTLQGRTYTVIPEPAALTAGLGSTLLLRRRRQTASSK